MRVLYVIDSLEPSGAEWSLLAMTRHLVDRGIELEVLHFGTGSGLGPRFEARGVPVTRSDETRLLARARVVRDRVHETGAALVHTTLFEADQAGRLGARWARTPVVSSLVNVAYGREQREATELPAWKVAGAHALDIATARLVRRWHAISRTVAEAMGRRLLIPSTRIDVVPRGRDPAVLGERTAERRARTRSQLGIAPETTVLLTAARQEAQKGLDVAIEVIDRFHRDRPDAMLLMAGRDGNASDQLRARVATAGLDGTVRMLGWRPDVPDLLVAADVLLFPSRWEGLGSVLLEAMALEIPIVSTDLPVVRELLIDDDGTELAHFAPVDDASALTTACHAALDGCEDRPARARARFLRYYTAERAAAGIAALYRRSLS